MLRRLTALCAHTFWRIIRTACRNLLVQNKNLNKSHNVQKSVNKINLKHLINFLIFIFQNSMGILSVYNMPLVSRTINVIDRCLHQYHSSNLAATKWETRHHLNERRKQREDLSWLKQTRSVVRCHEPTWHCVLLGANWIRSPLTLFLLLSFCHSDV